MESPYTAPIRRYGKPNAAQDALGPNEELSSPGFGSSALFGGLTAKDSSSDEDEGQDLSLDEIKKRYLSGSNDTHVHATNNVTQSVHDGETQQVDYDTQKISDCGTQSLGDETQKVGDETEQNQDDETQKTGSQTQNIGTFADDDETQKVEMNDDSAHYVSQNPTKTTELNGLGDGDDNDEDDGDIIKHRKRNYSFIDDADDKLNSSDDEQVNADGSPKPRQKKGETKKPKQMSKKEAEETERESRRMERELRLGPEARTNKQITVNSFLDMFEKPKASESSEPPSSPHKSEEEHVTPMSSPPPVAAPKEHESPALSRTRNVESKPFVTPRRLASFVNNTRNDSDDELEVVPSTRASTTSKSLQRLAELARVNPYAKPRVPVYKRTEKQEHGQQPQLSKFGRRSMLEQISNKQREQAVQNRQERMAEYMAKGGTIMSDQEKNKEAEIVENLLERERQKAEELRKKETGEYDDEEDEDYVAEDEDEGEGDGEDDNDNDEEMDYMDEQEEINEQADVLASPKKAERDEFDASDAEMDNQEIDHPDLIESSQPAFNEPEFSGTQLSQFPDPSQSPLGSPRAESEPEPELEQRKEVVNNDDEEDDVDDDKIKTKRRKLVTRDKPQYDRKKSAARGAVDDEALESDDEWAGIGGDDNDGEEGKDPDNYNLENLVDDNNGEQAVETENQGLWVENERERDETLVNKLMDDVTNGGWRKRRAGDGGAFGLSDDEEDAEEMDRLRAKREEQKRLRLLEESNLTNLAENPKARAFIDSIADRSCSKTIVQERSIDAESVKDSLSFLDCEQENDLVVESVAETVDNQAEDELLRTANVKPIDRISQRKMSRAQTITDVEVPVSRTSTIATMNAKYNAQKGTHKEVKVVQSLGGSNFNVGTASKASVTSKAKRSLKPLAKPQKVIPKASINNPGLFRQGGWD